MHRLSFVVYVVLSFVLLELSFCVEIYRRDILKAREERCGAVDRLPQLKLYTALHGQDVCVRVRLYVEPLLANEALKIDFSDSETGASHTLFIWNRNSTLLWNSTNGEQLFQPHKAKVQTRKTTTTPHRTYWILRYDCFPAQSGSEVSMSVYSHSDMLISASYIVEHVKTDYEDSMPEASVTVDNRAKQFIVKLQTDQIVRISLCYKHSYAECNELTYFGQIDPKVNPTVNLSFSYLVPCLCVQMWYTGIDTRRNIKCPLKESVLPQGGDILSSSSARVLGSVLHWEPVCPSDQSNPSVSLCWLIHGRSFYCVPAPNSTLYSTQHLKYNVSAVDKHPHMCVKFSLNGSHQVFCPFVSEGKSEWSVTVVPGSLHLHVRLTSTTAASFAAQLCVRDGAQCASDGPVISRHVDGGTTESEFSVPFPFLSSELCVQVWCLDPFLLGRRIICPEYTHRRWGLIIGAAFTLMVTVTVLVCITCYFLKRSTSVWRSAERRPLLLVCSSDNTAHVTAVCSLASGLQGELFMDVRLAQWAQCRSQSSLAQLGPVPWLFGQCHAVQKAGGVVLIAWSPDAHQAYLRWQKSNSVAKRKGASGMYGCAEDCCKDKEKMCNDEEWMEQWQQSSSITAPVFNSALACLWASIHSDSKGQGFGLVCFQGIDGSSDIPKHLRCVRRYCLPTDLPSLIDNLGSSMDGMGKTEGSRRCWSRLVSKALSFFASHQLAPRLKAGLPVSDRCSSKIIPKFSRKLKSGTKWKMLKRKKRQSKVTSSCLSRKKSSEAELLGAQV
ncbi:interleukin-17 receptor E-like [Myxocyprinus asiaticus]|uniref:interleukin-17 receptor E-like n=1 Tax=Myxocyprinus asiaticus TaxID=70543 RepID=UPI0022218939|nr:interleukin-17 receptor E-like [Myxocyprinus asiaticus]